MSNKHTILSIGPLYDTSLLADNTRALWTASYMFSFLMQNTILQYREISRKSGKTDKQIEDSFVIPKLDYKYLVSGNKAGLYHDRLIVRGEEADSLNMAFSNSLDMLSYVIHQSFLVTQGLGDYALRDENGKKYKFTKLAFGQDEKEKITEFVHGYFHSYIATADIPVGTNSILALSEYMDGIEHQPQLAPHEEKEYLFYFFRVANLALTKYFAFLSKDARDDGEHRCFKSLAEIATFELTQNWRTIDKKKYKPYFCPTIQEAGSVEDDIYKVLKQDKNFKNKLKPYHKYTAIVYADGDGFSKHFTNMGDDKKKMQDFSTNIFQFGVKATEIIRDNGGEAVLVGGDDLFFFVPVINGDKNIFAIVSEIDASFKEHFPDDALSMSYGVSISYHKFPLQESIKIAKDSLFDEAKKAKWVNRSDIDTIIQEKNAIHINIQKHSGQSHGLTLQKDTDLYDNFIKLIKQELNHDDTLHLPHSLHHSLERVSAVIDSMDASNIKYFFDNMFNEKLHKTKHDEALHAIQKILMILKEDALYRQFEKDDKSVYTKEPSQILFSMLSIIKMLRGDA